jgi:hypothetical protein
LIGDFIFSTECSTNSEKSRFSTPDAANTCYINIIFSLFHIISHQIAEKMNNEMQPKSGYVSRKDYKKEKKSNIVNMALRDRNFE